MILDINNAKHNISNTKPGTLKFILTKNKCLAGMEEISWQLVFGHLNRSNSHTSSYETATFSLFHNDL